MVLSRNVSNILKTTFGRAFASTLTKTKDHNLDPIQEQLLNETCFLVNENDKIVGTASKKECHLIKKDRDLLLHRAFSVFLFNKKGDLLLQKRSPKKVTFPNCYTNTCCSHPIADIPGEDEESDALGIKRAAQRRLKLELGIPIEAIPIQKLNYITRFLYKDEGDGIWGEHELDYILFLQDDIQVNPNLNEISEVRYISRAELDDWVQNLKIPLTPWFRLLLKHKLKFWWDNLDNLDKITDHNTIPLLR